MKDNALFQFSMENALELLFFFDAEGRIEKANRTARNQLGYGKEPWYCRVWDIFPEIFEEGRPLFEKAPMETDVRSLMMYRNNRTCFPAKVRFQSFPTEDKTIYVCMAYDATDAQLLEKMTNTVEQEMEEAEKMKSGFVANVTHELRTPVNGILGNTRELICMETDKKKLQLLEMMERGCRDMHALINNILDFSKLDAGKFTLENREFNFRSMMEYVEGNHRSRMTEKGLEFSVSIASGIPETVTGDELRIVQILNNLISNAYKFTSVGAVNVEVVKTSQAGNRIELFFMVMDSGIGIAKADQEKLFKSFSQVDASISRKYGGTGLGLNISRQLVELMNGNIHVHSEAGKGTVFSFNIWLEIQEKEEQPVYTGFLDTQANSEQVLLEKLMKLNEEASSDKIMTYGTKENAEEVEKKLSKLVLSVEMENWEKAESFAETVKQLLGEAPREIKSTALRLKMSVQKADYDKTMAAVILLRQAMAEE